MALLALAAGAQASVNVENFFLIRSKAPTTDKVCCSMSRIVVGPNSCRDHVPRNMFWK